MYTNLVVRTIALAFLFVSLPAAAFSASPEGAKIEKLLVKRSQGYWDSVISKLASNNIRKIKDPVHEEIVNRMRGCGENGDSEACNDPEIEPANAYVLAGARWNDDPPFRFEAGYGNFKWCEAGSTVRFATFPDCWMNVFLYGEKVASRGQLKNIKSAPLLIRSHFGDMQFLHSMSSYDGESPAEARSKIMIWSEFTWRIASREFPVSMPLKNVPVEGIPDLFSNKGWSIQDLFALGNPYVRKPNSMADYAFGSLLHIVADSFANSHTERAPSNGTDKCVSTKLPHAMPGKIVEFHSYVMQDSSKHAKEDSRESFLSQMSPQDQKATLIEVGRTLNDYFERRASWDEVKPYIECVFTLDTNARPGSAGEKYARE